MLCSTPIRPLDHPTMDRRAEIREIVGQPHLDLFPCKKKKRSVIKTHISRSTRVLHDHEMPSMHGVQKKGQEGEIEQVALFIAGCRCFFLAGWVFAGCRIAGND